MPVTNATVTSTRSPVRISFRFNCIFTSFQDRSFRAAAQKLRHHRIFRLPELLGLPRLNNLSLVKHSHFGTDSERAVHLVGDNNRSYLRFLGETYDQFVDD